MSDSQESAFAHIRALAQAQHLRELADYATSYEVITPFGSSDVADNMMDVEGNKHVDVQVVHMPQKLVRAGRYLVHAFVPSTNTIYEVYQCRKHGCRYHNPVQSSVHPTYGITYKRLRDIVLERESRMRADGFRVVSRYACHAINGLPMPIRPYLDMLNAYKFDPRSGFYGGRTGVNQHMYLLKPGQVLKYGDYTSLYPAVNCRELYPAGHPVIKKSYQVGENGLLHCTILPPNNDEKLMPVLGCHFRNKFVFPICRSCMENAVNAEENAKEKVRSIEVEVESGDRDERTVSVDSQVCTCARGEDGCCLLEEPPACPHDASERALTGTWCTKEIELALTKGYQLVFVHEFHYFEEMSNQFFKTYMRNALADKTESSGWPVHTLSDDPEKRAQLQEEYLESFRALELGGAAIRVDPSKVAKNAGRRLTSKFRANSLWGKLAQMTNRRNHVTLSLKTDYMACVELMRDQSIRIVDSIVHGPDNSMITFAFVKSSGFEQEESTRNSNIYIAAFTTAYARIWLYNLFDKLGTDQVLYWDTDSVVYVLNEGQTDPIEYQDCIGGMTDELADLEIDGEKDWECRGEYGGAFVATGPKSYAIRINAKNKPDMVREIVKSKGVQMNASTSSFTCFDSYLDLVRGCPTAQKLVPQFTIRRVDNGMESCRTSKKLRVSDGKGYRRNGPTRRVTPYGLQPTRHHIFPLMAE